MEAIAPFVMVGWFFAFGIPLSLIVLAFSACYRLKGIERAAWAIVSQLRASRMEQTPDVDPAATRRAREVADEGHPISLSMFGR